MNSENAPTSAPLEPLVGRQCVHDPRFSGVMFTLRFVEGGHGQVREWLSRLRASR